MISKRGPLGSESTVRLIKVTDYRDLWREKDNRIFITRDTVAALESASM